MLARAGLHSSALLRHTTQQSTTPATSTRLIADVKIQKICPTVGTASLPSF